MEPKLNDPQYQKYAQAAAQPFGSPPNAWKINIYGQLSVLLDDGRKIVVALESIKLPPEQPAHHPPAFGSNKKAGGGMTYTTIKQDALMAKEKGGKK